MSKYYYKAEGYDFLGFPCVVYLRTQSPVRNAKELSKRLYCEETGHCITRVHQPRLSYTIAYLWYTLCGKHSTAEDWSAEATRAVSV